jgi:hypothetical protein
MNNLKKLLLILAISVIVVSCEDDDTTVAEITLDAGTLSGGPFTFTVDGNPDMVSGITLDASTLTGSFQNYVITDAERNILGLPPTLEAIEGVNFDEAGEGSCYIYHLTYEEGLNGLEAGENLDNLSGDFDLSNFITVNRNGLNAGVLAGGPFDFTVNGMADMVSGITLDDTLLNGDNQTYVITDDANTILGLPPTLAAVEGVDFDEAGAGVCLIWHLTYADGLTGLEAGNNVSDLVGGYALSNSITVTRDALDGGALSGGPYEFVVDGTPDKATDLALDDTKVNGGNSGFVITDADLKILGLPPTLEAAQGVDFDGAGAGVCLIWHITYEDGLVGLEVGMNAGDLDGFFALSNSITVTRKPLDAGTLSGGPFIFTVDGTPDMVSDITLDSINLNGSNQTYVITDDALNILGLPPTLTAVEGVNFDEAGVGVCYIWHLTYEDSIIGLEAGKNAGDLDGFFDLSNFIKVTRE